MTVIKSKHDGNYLTFKAWINNPTFKVSVDAILTTLLEICARSRQISLRSYEHAFQEHLDHPIYFNGERDTPIVEL